MSFRKIVYLWSGRGVIVKSQCPICDEVQTVDIPLEHVEAFKKYQAGEGDIQNLLPFLDASEREILISGVCPKCWSSVFGGV